MADPSGHCVSDAGSVPPSPNTAGRTGNIILGRIGKNAQLIHKRHFLFIRTDYQTAFHHSALKKEHLFVPIITHGAREIKPFYKHLFAVSVNY